VLVPSSPPVVRITATLGLDDGVVDLATRVLVAGVVPEPRFGREAEVVATADALVRAGADLVDVSLPARLVGSAVRAVTAPVVVRADTVEAADAAGRAGVAVILAPLALLPEVGDLATGSAGSPAGGRAPAFAALVDDLVGIADTRAAAERAGVPLALDATRWSGAEAIAAEAVAVAEGCRILCSGDVRRSRRVAEVMSAVLGARRPTAATPNDDPEGLP
jgi:hypothetical protein